MASPSINLSVSVSQSTFLSSLSPGTWTSSMGCIPSKQNVLEGDSPAGIKPMKERKQRHKRLESPVLAEDAAPWVKASSRVLTEKDGCIIITERAS
ncbi:hypothetical protein C8T65DRAFT_742820 [Cerioporus squamosus]|nr:hypothetical protein C8T65DRAFT_742820 [Cerioporus squamosus]